MSFRLGRGRFDASPVACLSPFSRSKMGGIQAIQLGIIGVHLIAKMLYLTKRVSHD